MRDYIDRQAAIDALVNSVSEIGLHDNSEVARYGATFRQHEIIDIIEGLPFAQPNTKEHSQHVESVGDTISRQAAIDALNGEIIVTGKANAEAVRGYINLVEDRIKRLPSAEVEPVKRGKWIYDNQFHWYRASCSECGYKRVTDIKAEKWNDWSYCPHCGARMEKEE